MNKNAVIYARFSSNNQREESIEQQVDACKEYATSHSLNILKIYDDKALSGRTDARPSFLKMIEDSVKGKFKIVLVYKNDRFARNRYDSAIYKRELKNIGIKVVSVSENIPDTSAGIILETMLEGLAEYYSANLSENVKRGLYNNAQKGIPNSSLPFGYYKDDSNQICINPYESKIVKDLFDYVASGGRVSDYQRLLYHTGVRRKNGRELTKSSLYQMLKNERYKGTYIFGNIVIENSFEGIVTNDVFRKIKELTISRRKSSSTIKYILLGYLCCNTCKKQMTTMSGTARSGIVYNYYKCSNESCKEKKYIPKYIIESHMENEILNLLGNKNKITLLSNEYLDKYNLDVQIQNYIAKIADVKNRIVNIVNEIERGSTFKSLTSRLEELEIQEEYLIAKLNLLSDRTYIYSKEELRSLLDELYVKFNPTNYERALKLLVVKIFACYDVELSVEFSIKNVKV